METEDQKSTKFEEELAEEKRILSESAWFGYYGNGNRLFGAGIGLKEVLESGSGENGPLIFCSENVQNLSTLTRISVEDVEANPEMGKFGPDQLMAYLTYVVKSGRLSFKGILLPGSLLPSKDAGSGFLLFRLHGTPVTHLIVRAEASAFLDEYAID